MLPQFIGNGIAIANNGCGHQPTMKSRLGSSVATDQLLRMSKQAAGYIPLRRVAIGENYMGEAALKIQ